MASTRDTGTQWILAFDAGCQTCTTITDTVRSVVSEDLTIAGLAEPWVVELRRKSMGDEPRWAPTLLAVNGDDVRAWTGPALSVRLARLLGVAGSVRVVRALDKVDISRGRRKLLKAVPGLALGAFLVSGGLAAPAMAAGRESPVAKWVRANADRLPTTYADFTTYPLAYRRAIYSALPEARRAALWSEHLNRYRAAHPGLTARQHKVIDDAVQLVKSGVNDPAARVLGKSAVDAFGEQEAKALVWRLGPDDTGVVHPNGAQVPDCDAWCATDGGSGCGSGTGCFASPWHCNRTEHGCGLFWYWPCDGLCLPV
ncbi:hypothetical protein GCM10029964_015610 [Kibdelosporangium lantanae]